MPVFILLLFLGVAVLWLLLSFCFIPIGKFVYRLIKDAKTSMSKDDYKEKSEEKKSIKISVKDLLEDPFKNIRKDFTEKGEYLATITGYTDNGIFANIAQGVDTVCILPTWLDRPPFPGEKVIIKIYKIIPEKRKIYSSLIKIMGSDASE